MKLVGVVTHLFPSDLPGQLGGRQQQQRVANGRQLVPGGGSSGSAREQLEKHEEEAREGPEQAHLNPFQQAQRHGDRSETRR